MSERKVYLWAKGAPYANRTSHGGAIAAGPLCGDGLGEDRGVEGK